MSNAAASTNTSAQMGYQLTFDEKINLVVSIAEEQEKGNLPKGAKQKVTEATSH